MSKAIEDIPTMTATQRFIEIAKREDPEKWERAYALRDAVQEHLPDEARAAAGADGVNTGLYQAIAEVWEEAMDAGLVEAEIQALSKDYRTAIAWPDETRVKGATYAAHFELRDLDNRQGRLSKWVARSTTGQFGRNAARREKAELTRKKFGKGIVRPPERFAQTVERGLKKWAVSGHLSDNERQEAISILTAYINDLQDEKF